MKNNVILEILNEYERLQDANQDLQRQRQKEIYAAIPKIKEIDEKISSMGFEIAASVFKDINIEEFIVEQRKKITDLKIKKSEILNQNRYPVDYMEIKYSCSKCKDTAYVGNIKCSCFKQKLIDKYYAQSNLKDIVKRENFETFDLSLYSKGKDPQENISPYENIQSIFSYCINFSANFRKSAENDSLFFCGNSGLGKTFLSNCIAKDLLDDGKVVIYQTAGNLIEAIRNIKFDESISKNLLEDLMECDLLIIDDLGTEPNTAFSHSELFNLINTRILKKKGMIISTNYSLNELYNIYPERITSRIFGNFKIFKFFGDDIRIMKNKR
jgi:DNA replication protein DnaC